MLISTFWNHRLVAFHNRDAICDLRNVALAVPPSCPVPNSLDFLNLIVLGFFSPQENKYFVTDFHVCAKNY